MLSGSMPALSVDCRNSSRNGQNRGFKNDIILKNDEAIGMNHFRIRFCPFRNKYVIRDTGDG